jgi:asparagine synthase (glutamine-hydrolysing)
MCGIAGILSGSEAPQTHVLERMNARLAHRGPDASAVLRRPAIGLTHRRLAVIDLDPASNQPMTDSTGRFCIVYNGEIYNYQDLRRTLESGGVQFRTNSDTEVLLESYKRWGPACLDRLNGMFAFAIWNEPEACLFLARDRVGEKPLYYQRLRDGGLIFASVLKALREHPDVEGRTNPRALGQFLSLNYILSSECILEGVRKLRAGHYLVVRAGGVARETCYWDLARHFHHKTLYRSEGEAREALLSLIDDAVRIRLVSDVPLGAFLSGGLDSSTVVAAMRRLDVHDVTRTFSSGFREATFNELPEAASMARFLGSEHLEQVVDPDVCSFLPSLIEHLDEPFGDTSAIPVYLLSQFARRHVTVCLSGDGADEIFAGYTTYVADRLRQATRWVPAWASRGIGRIADALLPVTHRKVSADYKIRRFLRGHSLPAWRAHSFWRTIFSDVEKARLLRPEIREAVMAGDPEVDFARHFAAVQGCDLLDQAMFVDIKTWLPDDILVKVDRASMAHALEVRTPFLDHRLVEFAASLPVAWKMSGLETKYLIRRSQQGRLPKWVFRRRKAGFNAPVSQWLLSSLRELSESTLAQPALGDWLDTTVVQKLWEQHRGRKADHGLKLYGLTCLGLWMSQN